MKEYAEFIDYLFISFILSFVVCVVLLINYSLFAERKHTSHSFVVWSTGTKQLAWSIVLTILLLVAYLINNTILRKTIFKEFTEVLTEFDVKKDSIFINEKYINNPRSIVTQLNLHNAVMPNHSSYNKILRVKIKIDQKEHIMTFGRDENDSNVYYFYDERYRSLTQSELRIIRTNAFDGY